MTVAACGLKIDGLPLACKGDWMGADGACDCMGKLCEHQVAVEDARLRGWIRLERIERDGVHNKIVYIGRAPDTGGASYRAPRDITKNSVIKVHNGRIVEVAKGGKILWQLDESNIALKMAGAHVDELCAALGRKHKREKTAKKRGCK